MFALQWRDIKAACAKAVNLCADDPRAIDYANEAMETLLCGGNWKGTTQTFRICINASSCVVWPREIETPLAVAFCNFGAPIRSKWFEFSENGFGTICPESNCLNALVDREEVPAFDEVLDPDGAGDKRFAVYADVDEDAGKYIWLEFYDPNGQWVRTEIDNIWYDGERIAIPTTKGTYAYSTKRVKAGGLVRVRKDTTNGIIRLYEHNVTTAALRPLGYYQPDEIVPMYRRSLVPNYGSDSCEQQQMVVAAKLRFIPITGDQSWVLISHRGAMRLGCKAVLHEECDQWDKSAVNWGQAFNRLGMQLANHNAGQRMTLNVQSSATWGGGGTCNVM